MEVEISDDEDKHPLVKLTSLAVLGLGLTLLFLGVDLFWLVFVVGFAVVVPIVKVVTEEFGVGRGADERIRRTPDSASDPDSTRDALDALRERYARDDLSEAEFERKVENLLETETPESARRHVESEDRETTRRERREPDLETDQRKT